MRGKESMTENKLSKLLTVQEVSEILQANPKTVYQWAEQGQIPCLKINGLLRFEESEVLAWILHFKKTSNSSYNPTTQARSPRRGGK